MAIRYDILEHLEEEDRLRDLERLDKLSARADEVQEQEKERARELNSSIYHATRTDPAHNAEIIDLADKQGIPRETVERNFNEAKARQRQSAINLNLEGVERDSPKLTEWLYEQRNADVAIDDIEVLKGIERTLAPEIYDRWGWQARWGRQAMREKRERNEHLDDMLRRYRVNIGNERWGTNFKVDDPNIWFLPGPSRLKQTGNFLNNTGIDLINSTMLFADSMVGAVSLVVDPGVETFVPEDIRESVSDSNPYNPVQAREFTRSYFSKGRKKSEAKVAAAKGFLGKLDALLENPDVLFGMAVESSTMMLGIASGVRAVTLAMLSRAGLIAGTPGAAAYLSNPKVVNTLMAVSGAMEGMLAAGSIYNESRRQGRTYGQSALPSVAAGFFTALISVGGSKILPDAEVSLAKAGLSGEGITLKEASKNLLKAVLKEGPLEELPQEMQETFWSNVAQGLPVMQGVPEAGAMGLATGMAMGGGMSIGASSIEAANRVKIKRSRLISAAMNQVAEQDQIDNIISLSQSATMQEHSPEKLKEFVDLSSDSATIFIEAKKIQELIDKGLEVPSIIADNIAESVATGGDIEIALGDFATLIVPNEELTTALRPHLRLKVDSKSKSDFTEQDESLKALLKEAAEEEDLKTESDEVFENIVEQLIATGRLTPTEAKHSAIVMPAYITVASKKTGISVKEIYEKMFNLTIEGPSTPQSADVPNVGTILNSQELSQTQVNVTTTIEETGETVTYQEDAGIVINDIQERIELTERLRECLRS